MACIPADSTVTWGPSLSYKCATLSINGLAWPGGCKTCVVACVGLSRGHGFEKKNYYNLGVGFFDWTTAYACVLGARESSPNETVFRVLTTYAH